MSHSWLVAMGIDARHPLGFGSRSLLGHRLLLILREGAKSMRELHAATGRTILASDLRAALAELQESGLVTVTVTPSGRQGGRPRETWTLLHPESSAIPVAREEVAAASARRGTSSSCTRGWKPPTVADLRRAGIMPPEGGRRRRRRLKPVPENVADDVCMWICQGQFLRDYCRQPGTPSTRTIYNWAAKDPPFADRFRRARDIGEDAIRDEYADVLLSPVALAAFAAGKKSRREFNRRFIQPFDLRLQRWRRHPTRGRAPRRAE